MKALLIKKTKEIPAASVMKEYVRFDFVEVDINGLDDMQKAVEGDIEGWDHIPELYKNGIVLYCNDEGKIQHKLPAVLIVSKKTSEIIEALCGNILLCGYDLVNDKTVSLTPLQMKIISRVFKPGRYLNESKVIDGYAVELEVGDDA